MHMYEMKVEPVSQYDLSTVLFHDAVQSRYFGQQPRSNFPNWYLYLDRRQSNYSPNGYSTITISRPCPRIYLIPVKPSNQLCNYGCKIIHNLPY